MEREARIFAGNVTDLLNGTVCDGIRLTAVHRAGTSYATVAPGIHADEFNPGMLPLKIGRAPAAGYLFVAFTAELDDANQFLMVTKSQFGLYLDGDRKRMLLHYDFNRAPANDYPDAHVQVGGGSKTLRNWCRRRKVDIIDLPRLHLPVGGRRYRPTIEDVIEMLVVEDLAMPRPDWQKVVGEHRRNWYETQVKAIVRRNPIAAVTALNSLGYTISGPDPKPEPTDKRKRR